MRMVMPAIVPHSEEWPYTGMARFENGPTGNPHWHGFSVGRPGPQVKRVVADVDGAHDLPPSTVDEDLRVVLRALRAADDRMEWVYDVLLTASEVKKRL